MGLFNRNPRSSIIPTPTRGIRSFSRLLQYEMTSIYPTRIIRKKQITNRNYIKLVRFTHNLSRASLREPQSLTTRSCDWNDGTIIPFSGQIQKPQNTSIFSLGCRNSETSNYQKHSYYDNTDPRLVKMIEMFLSN